MKRPALAAATCLLFVAASIPARSADRDAAAPTAARKTSARLYQVEVDGKIAFVDETGRLAFKLPADVYTIHDFAEGRASFGVRVAGPYGKWGCIDETGKVVIAPRFGSPIGQFSEGLASVLVSDDPIFVGRMGFIDRGGQMVIAPQFLAPASQAYDYRGPAGYFSEKLAAVQDSMGGWGFVDRTGAFVIKPQFSEASPFSEGLAAVAMGPGKVGDGYLPQRWGFVDRTGKVVIPAQFSGARSFSEGLASVIVGADSAGKIGYVDKSGRMVIAPQFETYGPGCGDMRDYSISFSEGKAPVGLAYRFGYIDRTGKVVIRPRYDCAGPFSGGLARVGLRDGGKARFGYIDTTGKMVIDARFDEAWSFVGPLARASIGLTEDEIMERAIIDMRAGKPKAGVEKSFQEGLKNKASPGLIDRTGKFVWKGGGR